MKVWSAIATWGLAILIAVNIAGTAYYFLLQGQVREARPQAALAEGSTFPIFSGVDVLGAKWEARDVPCRVIRIADDRCSFCRKDKPSYEQFLEAARLASCEVVEMAPQAGGMAHDPRPGVVQLQFVDVDVGSVLFPFATPQTIILDSNWSVKMTRRGTFNEESLAHSMALLGTFAATRAGH